MSFTHSVSSSNFIINEEVGGQARSSTAVVAQHQPVRFCVEFRTHTNNMTAMDAQHQRATTTVGHRRSWGHRHRLRQIFNNSLQCTTTTATITLLLHIIISIVTHTVLRGVLLLEEMRLVRQPILFLPRPWRSVGRNSMPCSTHRR